jgi:hypothetical protein
VVIRHPLRFVTALLAAPLACVSAPDNGIPGAPSAILSESLDATIVSDAAAPPPAPPNVSLVGRVVGVGGDAGVENAIVVVEVGGLDRPIPDASAPDGAPLPTLTSDPYIELSALTPVDEGGFAFQVPEGAVGLHVLAPSFLESLVATTASSADAHPAPTVVALTPLPKVDGAPPARPIATELTPSAPYVLPGSPITFLVQVAAASPSDPLSRDVFLVEPATQMAVALAPPTPGIPGGAYPDGVYSLIVTAPNAVGSYTYTVVAASLGRVTSEPVSVSVAVTWNGGPAPVDASYSFDAVFEGGGLPDGRI